MMGELVYFTVKFDITATTTATSLFFTPLEFTVLKALNDFKSNSGWGCDRLIHGSEEQWNTGIHTSEPSSDEQLREVPLPRSRYSANEYFQVQQGKQVAQEKQKICISPALAGALDHLRLREQWPFLLLPALDVPWLGTMEVFWFMNMSVGVLSGEAASQKGLWYCSPLQCTQNTVSVQIQVLLSPPDSVHAGWLLKRNTCKPGLKKGLVSLLVGEQAGRSWFDGWEASKQERSLGTRWNLGSNSVLAGRPLTGHLTSLCSNKPNCKFVYKLKTRCCIW